MNDIISYGIPYALRTGGIAALQDDLIESIQELLGERNTDPHQFLFHILPGLYFNVI
jgi:hypothetical protein